MTFTNNGTVHLTMHGGEALLRQDIGFLVQYITCSYGEHKFTIDADGRAFPCPLLIFDFLALTVKEVGVKKAFQHTIKKKGCVACPFIVLNDWNYMMSLDPKILLKQVPLHTKELIWKY